MTRFSLTFVLILFLFSNEYAQKMTIDHKPMVKIHHLAKDFGIADLSDANWNVAEEVTIDKFWSGENAPAGRRVKARLLWSDTALYVRFEAAQKEPLIVSDTPNISAKTLKLWDRDVCEIFIAPDKIEARKYFEFEIAPTGEWVDLAID